MLFFIFFLKLFISISFLKVAFLGSACSAVLIYLTAFLYEACKTVLYFNLAIRFLPETAPCFLKPLFAYFKTVALHLISGLLLFTFLYLVGNLVKKILEFENYRYDTKLDFQYLCDNFKCKKIIKRPVKATPLSNKINYQIFGKSIRYDVYL